MPEDVWLSIQHGLIAIFLPVLQAWLSVFMVGALYILVLVIFITAYDFWMEKFI